MKATHPSNFLDGSTANRSAREAQAGAFSRRDWRYDGGVAGSGAPEDFCRTPGAFFRTAGSFCRTRQSSDRAAGIILPCGRIILPRQRIHFPVRSERPLVRQNRPAMRENHFATPENHPAVRQNDPAVRENLPAMPKKCPARRFWAGNVPFWHPGARGQAAAFHFEPRRFTEDARRNHRCSVPLCE